MTTRPIDSRSAVFDAALDAIITIDHEGRIVEFNLAAEQIFGLARDRACGRLLADTIIPPAFRLAHVEGLRRYLATGEARVLGRRIFLAALRADGS
jgi:PAS domain S-box-containing protein